MGAILQNKKIAKMSGNKKKMEASDFKKLRMFKKKRKLQPNGYRSAS